MKPKKKTPSDLTLRNLRAMKSRVNQLHQWLEGCTFDLSRIFKRLDRIEYLMETKKK